MSAEIGPLPFKLNYRAGIAGIRAIRVAVGISPACPDKRRPGPRWRAQSTPARHRLPRRGCRSRRSFRQTEARKQRPFFLPSGVLGSGARPAGWRFSQYRVTRGITRVAQYAPGFPVRACPGSTGCCPAPRPLDDRQRARKRRSRKPASRFALRPRRSAACDAGGISTLRMPAVLSLVAPHRPAQNPCAGPDRFLFTWVGQRRSKSALMPKLSRPIYRPMVGICRPAVGL